MRGSLAGMTVVDLSRMLPGPYCSMILADHGARVIAVEDKRFADNPFFIHTVYRNKEHMCLNLKTEAGLQVLKELVSTADVLIEGFRPGVAARLGIDFPSLQAVNSRLIYCSISGYGQTGPYNNQAGHDVNYMSAAGVLDLIGPPEGAPVIPGVQIADLVGGMNAAVGILMAVVARQQTGKGQYIDISMTDAVVGLLPLVLNFYHQTGQSPQRGNSLLSNRYACYHTYATADGRALSVGALEPKFWARLCTHLGLEEYIDLQFDEARREEIVAEFKRIMAQKSLAQWEEELVPLDVCCQGVRTLEEALAHPLFHERGMVQDFPDQNNRQVPTLGLPVQLSHTPGSLRTRPARFGEHTREILGELGYSQDQVQDLAQKDVF